MWRYYLPVVGLGLLGIVFFVGLDRNVNELPSPFIGKPAPRFALETLDDPQVRLTETDLKGRATLLNVWGTWCPECQNEHPLLMEIAAAGVPIFSINWKDDDALARRWLAQLGDPYVKTGADRDGQAAIEWGVYGAPETFLVDAQGIVRFKHVGPITAAVWREELQPLLQRFGDAQPAGEGQETETLRR